MNTLQKALGATMLLLCAAATKTTRAADAADNLVYTGCSEQTSLLLLPAVVMPTLPPGFAYAGLAGGSQMAAIHISGTICDSVNGGTQPDETLLAFALVTPPANLVVPEVPYYAIALGGYTNRAETLAQFEAWGIPDLVQPGKVSVDLSALPLARVAKTKAVGATSKLLTQSVAVGPTTTYEAGRTRAYYIRDGVLISSFDALYTPQTSIYAAGTIVQTGSGFLPTGVYPSVGSHAFDYDLTVGFVEYY